MRIEPTRTRRRSLCPTSGGHRVRRARSAVLVVVFLLPATVIGTPASLAASGATSSATARPAAGNSAGHETVPVEARRVNTSHPTRVVGRGTAASCASVAVVRAVARGGIITFACGPKPVTITMTATAKVRNDRRPNVVIDGGGKVTLSGAGVRRVLYQDTCDPVQGVTSSHCQDQATPRLVLQNLTIVRGNATGQHEEGGGGGAVLVRGGQVRIVNSRFFLNRCDATGPDLGGAAVRVLSQYQNRPVYVVHSTFGGAAGWGNSCSNGGALSSIGVSWVVLNSVISYNQATGHGANPQQPGTAGGGSGAGIYNDGNDFTLTVGGTRIDHNHANEGGAAIFFVSNDRTGRLTVRDSLLTSNRNDTFETAGLPGIFFLGAGRPLVVGSTIR